MKFKKEADKGPFPPGSCRASNIPSPRLPRTLRLVGFTTYKSVGYDC